MAFWGIVVKPGKSHAYVPPPEDWNLHLSQATLEPTVPEGQRVAVAVRAGPEEEPVLIATLTAGKTDTALLDLFFAQYAEFSVIGEHPVHLTGYYSLPQTPGDDDDDEGEEEDDEEYQPHHALGFPLPGELDDDEDEDDEDEDEDEEDSDDEDGLLMADGDDDEMFGYPVVAGRRKKPHVVIEEVKEDGKAEEGKAGGKAAAKGGKAGKKEQALPEALDEDEEMEDQDEEDEEEEGSEEGSEDEEEEDSEEEEEEAPAKGGKKEAAAAAAATPGSKRPAAAAAEAAANGAAAKAAAPASKKQAVGEKTPQPVAKGAEAKAQKQQQQQQQPQTQQKQQQQQPQETPKTQQKQKQEKEDKAGGSADKKKSRIRKFPNGFEVEDVTYGNPNAKLAKSGQKVSVRYTGRLKTNGKVFDKTTGKPFQFRLGVGEVIKGWDLGVEGMRVGDKRRLVIPPQLAYGTSGVKGTIPPNATLEFDVELVDVK